MSAKYGAEGVKRALPAQRLQPGAGKGMQALPPRAAGIEAQLLTSRRSAGATYGANLPEAAA